MKRLKAGNAVPKRTTLPRMRLGARVDGPAKPVTPHIDIGRNDPCHCGSGKKFKKCCMKGDKHVG